VDVQDSGGSQRRRLQRRRTTDPGGLGATVHRYTREDEAWIVLDGEVTFFIDDEQHPAGPGTYVFGPRGRAHIHRVESDTARIATCSSPAPAKPSSAPPDDGIEFLAPPPAQ
jgi:mannose-6-phosphate isomerase-like protein (cupin superfamily)